jgi:hypothetical protein
VSGAYFYVHADLTLSPSLAVLLRGGGGSRSHYLTQRTQHTRVLEGCMFHGALSAVAHITAPHAGVWWAQGTEPTISPLSPSRRDRVVLGIHHIRGRPRTISYLRPLLYCTAWACGVLLHALCAKQPTSQNTSSSTTLMNKGKRRAPVDRGPMVLFMPCR